MANVLFNSKTIEENGSAVTYSATFYSSTFSDLEDFILGSYQVGTSTNDLGTIQKLNYRTEGTIWYCDVTGEKQQNSSGISYNLASSGPTEHSLTTVCIPLPLKMLDNYKTCWDHFLWCSSQSTAQTPPDSVKNATSSSPVKTSSVIWVWTEDGTPPESGAWLGVEVDTWYAASDGSTAYPTKPGTSTFDYYTYQITESSEHNSEKDAYWTIKKVLNKPMSKPILGSFGIAGGTWKLENASVSPNGKKFAASLTWTWAEDGWDTDIYPPTLKSKVI